MLDYSASKGAMATFTRSLATQVFGKGIRVCGVAPGPVYTPLQPASRPAEQMEDWSVGSVRLYLHFALVNGMLEKRRAVEREG